MPQFATLFGDGGIYIGYGVLILVLVVVALFLLLRRY